MLQVRHSREKVQELVKGRSLNERLLFSGGMSAATPDRLHCQAADHLLGIKNCSFFWNISLLIYFPLATSNRAAAILVHNGYNYIRIKFN